MLTRSRGTGHAVSNNERGATAVEYALILALASLAILAGATLLGESLNTFFDIVGDYFDMGGGSPF